MKNISVITFGQSNEVGADIGGGRKATFGALCHDPIHPNGTGNGSWWPLVAQHAAERAINPVKLRFFSTAIGATGIVNDWVDTPAAVPPLDPNGYIATAIEWSQKGNFDEHWAFISWGQTDADDAVTEAQYHDAHEALIQHLLNNGINVAVGLSCASTAGVAWYGTNGEPAIDTLIDTTFFGSPNVFRGGMLYPVLGTNPPTTPPLRDGNHLTTPGYEDAADVWNTAIDLIDMGNIGDPALYTAATVDLERTSSQLFEKATIPTGITDSNQGTMAFFWRMESDTQQQRILMSQGLRFFINFTSANVLRMRCQNSVGTVLFLADAPGTFSADALWHSYVCTWDLSNSANRGMWLDGVDVEATAAWTTYTDGTIEYEQVNAWGVGAQPVVDNSPFDGCLAEVYFDDSYIAALDISLYTDASNKPVGLGATGATLSGSQPLIYMNEAGDNFGNNKGSGGLFPVQNGPTAACASSPSD